MNTRRPKTKAVVIAHRTSVSAVTWPRLRDVVLASIVVLLGAAIAYAISSRAAEVWESVSEVEYRGDSFVETAAISAASHTEVEAVARQFDLDADDVEMRFVVLQIPNSEILQLRYRDEDRSRSLEILRSLTDVVTDRTNSTGIETQIVIIEEELGRVRADRVERRSDVDTVDPTDGALVDASTTAALEEIAVLSRQISDLELRLVDLQLRRIEEAPIVVTAPYTTTDPVGPRPLRAAVLGAFAGFAVSATVFFVSTRQR